jgi:hypothetical protein
VIDYKTDDFRVRVFHDHTGKEICPHDFTDEVVPSFFPWNYCIDKNTTTPIIPRKIDELGYWPPFSSTSRYGRPWVAVRHLGGLKVLPPECPCCGHRWGQAEPLETSLRLILVVWGAGKNCLGAGYQIRQTIAEVTGEPYNLW